MNYLPYMRQKLIYRDSKILKWLTAIVLSVSCFAFSLSSVPANAGQPLPTHIERVVSSRNSSDDSPVSYQKVAATAYSFHSVNTSRDYEKEVAFTCQKEIQVHFESQLEKVRSFLVPGRFQPVKIIPQDTDEDVSPSLFV